MVLRNREFRRRGGSSEGRGGRRFLILLLVVAGAGYLGYRQFINMTLDKANEALVRRDYQNASLYFERVSGLPFNNGRGHDGLGVLKLLEDDREAAREHFRIVLEHKPSRFGGDPAAVLDLMIEEGRYEAGRIYLTFLQNWKEADALQPYLLDFAAIQLGVRDLKAAKPLLEKVTAQADNPRYEKVTALAKQYEEDGAVPVLLDRNGKAILQYDMQSEAYAFATPKLFAGWNDPNGEQGAPAMLSERERMSRIHTTLDLNLQQVAHQAMEGYNGTMIMVSPQNGEILAAYGTDGNNPFTRTFEPGSVIKVLTYGIFLENGGDVKPFAPRKYPGNMKIGDRILYDWTTQGQLNTVEEGMAVSCNLMFAQMGLEQGWPKLGEGYRGIFDDRVGANLLTAATPGRVNKEPENAYELGRIAIGLDFLDTSVVGLVMIPTAVANGGKVAEPWMLKAFSNLEDQPFHTPEPSPEQAIFSAQTAAKLVDSMAASMEAPRGTARRAKVDLVKAAMKTGTAGDRPHDSIMIGIFPVEKPKVAFAFFLDRGGKCEINGARVAKRLQEQMSALAPSYLAD
ncbi:penicillin-binding transpeptidase domain-containing protein [Acanthopleuribacter pedis]|uniref:beta-lactamase n=1 Tax=Acanthopleuribacter pedis TaxID=442870 RepID=A0A8J7Q9K8_9BACT|nr:penicillin-binding transpeptidase domain-containing protein [Acanthopleuribacter pedis]MBO1321181.1 hypothetical protein [Acanthopleuribacter pedis]